MESLVRTLRECPEFGTGTTSVVDVGVRSVLALCADGDSGTMLALTNLAEEPCVVNAGPVSTGEAVEVFGDDDYEPPDPELAKLELNPFGYRWIRLSRRMPSRPVPTTA
jgi:maltose alpha-D-glucosyltransferase/alpha-amylase